MLRQTGRRHRSRRRQAARVRASVRRTISAGVNGTAETNGKAAPKSSESGAVHSPCRQRNRQSSRPSIRERFRFHRQKRYWRIRIPENRRVPVLASFPRRQVPRACPRRGYLTRRSGNLAIGDGKQAQWPGRPPAASVAGPDAKPIEPRPLPRGASVASQPLKPGDAIAKVDSPLTSGACRATHCGTRQSTPCD